MVLICSATLNKLEITTTNYKKKKIPSDQNTQNMKFTSTLKEWLLIEVYLDFFVVFLSNLDIVDTFLLICKEQCTCLKISK
jgi:hypothetical protein